MAGRHILLCSAALAVVVSMPAAPQIPADDLRVRQLENEVLRLQREIDAQSRRIDQLERSVRGTVTSSAPRSAPIPPRDDSSPAWLVMTNWDKVRRGMKDLDVIALLGRPTSVRTDPDGKAHALLYAMELGPTAVLAGNVRVTEAGVVEINRPVVR